MKPSRALIIVAACVLAAAGWSAVTYNRLVQSRLAVETQWAQVETQYQRRVNLIPSLTAAVSGALAQERTVLDDVARARTAYLAAPPGSDSRVQAANAVQGSLGRLIAVVEANPTLMSSETVARLMDELTGTENRIAVERRRYNERVRDYNILVQQFPTSLVAGICGFPPRSYFEAAGGAATPPTVTLPSP